MKIVGIGSSAGGIQALSELFNNLSPDIGAAFVVVQHISPDHKSVMDNILSKHTKMDIHLVDQDILLQPNHVYLISNGINLVVDGNYLRIQKIDKSLPINLSIDIFFNSLGKEKGKDSIAVILSGSGSDGSRGILSIKEQGGIVLVQSPNTALFDGMPEASIQSQIADSILSPPDLAKQIETIVAAEYKHDSRRNAQIQLKNKQEQSIFGRILKHLHTLSGINFSGYREATLLRRIDKRMLLSGTDSLENYLQFMYSKETEARALKRDFLIGVTRFFRDPEVYEHITKHLLPKIFKQNKPIRIWIPSCSTGEEAYSFAIIIEQYLSSANLNRNYKIFATDVDKFAVEKAMVGLYSPNITMDISPEILSLYFVREINGFRVSKMIRQKILFATHNLLSDPPFIHIDLISCKNFLIYLKPETQKQVLNTFHFALNTHGFLSLGQSETLGDSKNNFFILESKLNIFQKNTDAAPELWLGKFNAAPQNWNMDYTVPSHDLDYKAELNFSDSYQDPYSKYLVEHFAPVVIFVNQDLDILYSNGDLSQFLHLPQALAKFNLRKMMDSENAQIMQDGVYKALRTGMPTLYRNVGLRKEGLEVATNLMFQTVNLDSIDDEVILIEIKNRTTSPFDEESEVNEIHQEDYMNERVRNLEQELNTSKNRLKHIVGELEATNEELHSSNRELMASNEELQSTNEELQAVNEELFSVNAELTYKNGELHVANNDINNLLKSTEIGVIFLDTDLRIRRFTKAIHRQFDLLPMDVGRPITNFSNKLNKIDLPKVCRQVFDTLSPYQKEISDLDGNSYSMRILPYRTENNEIKGLVIVFFDINELQETRIEMEQHLKSFQAIFKYSLNTILIIEEDGTIVKSNKSLGELTSRNLRGADIFEIIPAEQLDAFKTKFNRVVQRDAIKSIHVKLLRKNGKLLILRVNLIPHYAENKEETLVMAVVQDITQKEQQKATLEQTIKQFEAIFDNALDQIVILDKNYIIRYINFIRNPNHDRKEYFNTNMLDHAMQKDRKMVKNSLDDVFAGKPFSRYEINHQHKDGYIVNVSVIITPVPIDHKIELVAMISRLQEES